jgi:hypothetical protein
MTNYLRQSLRKKQSLFHNLNLQFLEIHFNISLLSRNMSRKLFYSSCYINILYVFLVVCMLHIPAYIMLLISSN